MLYNTWLTSHRNARCKCSPHIKYKNMRKQNAMKPPIMNPSLLFFADILPIKLFNPGTWLAAPVIRRLMLANVSL